MNMLEELKNRFVQVEKRTPIHVNELLDYLQISYIYGELSIVEYKTLFLNWINLMLKSQIPLSLLHCNFYTPIYLIYHFGLKVISCEMLILYFFILRKRVIKAVISFLLI